MKVLQALLFGAVAGLLATGPATAAERHVKAQAADHDKECSAYGPGFHYVPGADLCMKVGGWVRAEAGGGRGLNWGALNGNPNDRSTGNAGVGARGYLTTDVREQTQYGTVRGYLSVGANHQ
jgi:hypothetical protein